MSYSTLAPSKVSFLLKTHDSDSLEVILWYLFWLLLESSQPEKANLSQPWVQLIKEKIGDFCAFADEQDESEFWHRFRNVTAGFRALEGALNDSKNGFLAKVSFDPPANRAFRLSIRDELTGRFIEAMIRPKHSETVDLLFCVFEEPFDKMDLVRKEAEQLQKVVLEAKKHRPVRLHFVATASLKSG